MPAFKKIGGVWKEATAGLTKVNGVWRQVPQGHYKVPSVGWKVIKFGEPDHLIPSGLLVFYNTTDAVPTGWTAYTTSSNRYLIHRGGEVAINTNGGSAAATAMTCSTNGTHGATGTPCHSRHNPQPGFTYSGLVGDDGAHTHAATALWTPGRYELRIIQASQDHLLLPPKALTLSQVAHSGLTEVSDSTPRYIRAMTSAVGAQETSLTLGAVSTAGDHWHPSNTSQHNSRPYSPPVKEFVTGGTHAHSWPTPHNATITDSLYKAMLRAWSHASQSFGLKSKMIGMWLDAATIPTGWTACDGSNGAPDLRNHFIGICSTPSISGDGTWNLSVQTAPDWMYHGHNHGEFAMTGALAGHNAQSINHAHTFTQNTNRTRLLWRGMLFIMKT